MTRIASLSSAAPLMAIPEYRPPEGGVGEWFRGAGGLRLRLGFWQPRGPARGTVFVSPGRAEPIEKYYEVVTDLLARRFCVVVHDWRGQGLSARLLPDRLKGHARSEDEFLDDYQRLLDGFEDRAPKPWVMLGHSMGAALNLSTLTRGEERFSAAVFINPMLRIKTGKHSLWSVMFQTDWKVKHGQGSDYVPELFDDPFEHTFEEDALTHDAARYNLWREQLFACPHLAVGTPTWGWLLFALRIGDTLLKDKGKVLKKVRTPVSIVMSGDDSLMMKQPTKAFAKKLLKGRCIEIAGADHEILMELDAYRRAFWAEFDETVEFNLPGEALPAAALSSIPYAALDEVPVVEVEVAEPVAPTATEVFDSHVPAETVVEDVVIAEPQEVETKEIERVVRPATAQSIYVSYELSDVPVYAPPLPPERLSVTDAARTARAEVEVADWEETEGETPSDAAKNM
ncbi:alpha/beta hydrolase [Asticcacaulis sp. AND118]|uniref:alpha/beta hydrolase n=1 Tax=Asticcacaulis sp. AND118 TaxID=2840468 RepID=UPI001CFFC0A6|nr:alpha/beta hydrolase [Asticcacaulis sp. AND118]UDF05389.1 alpha/beta hydrolase [Asticcacaulis sp. AND118]